MERFNRGWLSMALIIGVISCCVKVYGAPVQDNEDILPDTMLFPRGRHVRHVPAGAAFRNGNRFPQSLTPIIDSDLGKKDLSPLSSETNTSAEITFSEEDEKEPWASAPSSSTRKPAKALNRSSVSLELETNSSNSLSFNVVDSSEFPSQSKIQRAVPTEKSKEHVVLDADKDKAFDENESEGSSKLWIYSNAICILLVVGVSIFLIYYPKKDRRKACKDASDSSTSSSSASSTA